MQAFSTNGHFVSLANLLPSESKGEYPKNSTMRAGMRHLHWQSLASEHCLFVNVKGRLDGDPKGLALMLPRNNAVFLF
jgi:hypothetical protein